MILLDPSRPIVRDNGIMQDQFRNWTLQIKPLIIGTGSPEGVVPASQGQEYMDDAGTAGAIKYVKRNADIGGDITQGWILI